MTYAKAKLNILLKSNSCSLSNNFIVNETNEIIETINNYSTFEIIRWELEFLNISYLNIILQTDNYNNSWKELKDIREESNNIINLLNTHKTFLISKWDFKIEKLIEDPKKSIEDVEKDIKETPNFPRGKETYITGYKIHDCRKEILESAEQFEKKTSPESAITERKTSILPYPILEETLKNMDIHPIIKKGIYALREDYNLKDYCVEYDIQREEINPEITPKEKKKKSLRELILAFLKKNGPSSVKQITLGVLNMGLVTQSKSPRMVVNSMLWKLCRDERYRQQDKKGAYYNPVILDNDRWRLKK